MKRILSLVAITGGLLAAGWLAPAARAEKNGPQPGVMRVEDNVGAFSADGIKNAKKSFENTTFRSPTHFSVVTVGEKDVPSALKGDYDAYRKDKSQASTFFRSWAKKLAAQESEQGIFVLVFLRTEGYYVKVLVDEQTDVYRQFPDKDAKKVSAPLIEQIVAAHGKPDDQAKASRDSGLIAATNVIIDELKSTSAPEQKTGRGHQAVANEEHHKEGSGIAGYICIGLVAILAVWVVVALIRAFTGGGGGGGGYGGGGYGGGGGGGGGGFFTSFLGGMFGAAAGMWMYNSFFGGNSMSTDAFASDSGSGSTGDTGAGNFDNGAEAGGGGDFGGSDDTGGGDFGDTGGGGDDVGGGDFGGDTGGGDFGGGGGDFGGGGGDW
ncbi:hypothetical protein [Fimbriiglobus ruber]|uniref:TPM domain-containing protein n=1 Tax=Fimbriiglobus ruber TaxID=1908690 RepID=A0A225DPG2_9BACT|nr:hypothetical protein [Fimbriiglobus ruber]OWK43191.1 hypothetical protein FRUB_02790 [Fimbriiglobus ruber]